VSLLLLLMLGQLNRGEPFIGQGGDKILIVKVRFESAEGKQAGPRGRSFQSAGMNCLEQVIVDGVKLGRDVIGAQVSNETNGAGMKGGRPHILALS
jgi:hypothetical protein